MTFTAACHQAACRMFLASSKGALMFSIFKHNQWEEHSAITQPNSGLNHLLCWLRLSGEIRNAFRFPLLHHLPMSPRASARSRTHIYTHTHKHSALPTHSWTKMKIPLFSHPSASIPHKGATASTFQLPVRTCVHVPPLHVYKPITFGSSHKQLAERVPLTQPSAALTGLHMAVHLQKGLCWILHFCGYAIKVSLLHFMSPAVIKAKIISLLLVLLFYSF